jgi:4-amino-4-deoxy-L-arabinose transferase-like glycosyltransferase
VEQATTPTGWDFTQPDRPGQSREIEALQPKQRSGAIEALRTHWERIALGAVLVLAAVLNLARLGDLGYANTYYAATVRSMLTSWDTFFFASFDPGGFVTVDKPPLGFWIQTLSAKLLGFSGISLILPEAIAGVLSAVLLYALVRRPFGPAAALIAALVLAISPVAVAVNRNNTIDALLILTLLGAVWCVLRAVERSSLAWLLAGSLLVGLGFNIKMLQAFLVVPALFLAYLLGSRLRWRTRVVHLVLASLVLLVVSLSWALVVDLTPASQRPYVGSSETNSELNLALGYNGLFRLLPSGWLPSTLTGAFGGRDPGGRPPGDFGGMPGFGVSGPGALRLFDPQLAGQITWLLPLAAFGCAAAWWQTRTRLPLDRRQTALVLWGTWLATGVCFFSVATSFTLMHRYYLAMLAPPIAALVGAGLVALWHDYRRPGWRGWLLPAALLGTVALHVKILADYSDWSARLAPPIVVLGILAALGLILARSRPEAMRQIPRRALPALAAVGLIAMLTAPAAWAAITVADSGIGMLPAGGPAGDFAPFGPPGASAQGAEAATGQEEIAALARRFLGRGGSFGAADQKLIAFLETHRDGERYLFATGSAMTASPYILATGEAVAALGGFSGADQILSNDQLAAMIGADEVRYFLVQSTDDSEQNATAGGGTPAGVRAFFRSENITWVNEHCTTVPDNEWQSATDDSGVPFGGREVLFDCQNAA